MKVLKSTRVFVVTEHLPWLEQPRIVNSFETKAEAEQEARRLNSKSMDSSFRVNYLGYTFEMGLVMSSEDIARTVNSMFRY